MFKLKSEDNKSSSQSSMIPLEQILTRDAHLYVFGEKSQLKVGFFQLIRLNLEFFLHFNFMSVFLKKCINTHLKYCHICHLITKKTKIRYFK